MNEAQKTIIRWRDGGPAVFAREALGVIADPWQEEASRILVERRRLSIRSGHGVGKTAFMAWAILWYMATRFPARIPVTAPTGHQLSDVLWAELARWHRVLKERLPPLGNEFVWSAEKFSLADRPEESFAVARTSRPEKPEALQGFHSENLLFVIDEASGVPDQVFTVAEGALSSEGSYAIMASNPTKTSGYFYDSHNRDRARWGVLTVNGENCSRVSKEYIEGMRKKYGPLSQIYKVRVLGDFAGDIDTVIPLEFCEAAIARDVAPVGGNIIWGLDVARFGDDSTCLARRQGNVMLGPIQEWFGKDTMQTVGLLAEEYRKAAKKPECINIDVIGIGAGVVDRAKEIGLPVNGINVAESASITKNKKTDRQYARLRDELWFLTKDWLEALDCRLEDDDELIGELSTPKYTILSNGTIKVESKAEMKARGVKSPNRADAFNMTFAPIKLKTIDLPITVGWSPLDRSMGY